MVVDDDQVGFGRALVHPGDEAALELRALLARAGLATGVYLPPEIARVGKVLEFRAVARLGMLFPAANLGIELHFREAREHRLLLEVVKLLPAKIILTPLHQRGLELDRHDLFQNRDIFVKKLLLKINRVRRDDCFFVLLGRPQDCRH